MQETQLSQLIHWKPNQLKFCIRKVFLSSDKWTLVFKTKLRKHYVDLTSVTLTVHDPAVPQTFKSVCIKCHMTRPLTALLVKLCC